MKLLVCLGAGTAAAAALFVTCTPTVAQDAPPTAFAACKACHSVNEGGRNGVGPNLHGVVGRDAASVAGFDYSPALEKSGLTWDAATLDAFLAAPGKKVPGTRMPIGMADPAKRAAIIKYLKAQS